MTGLATSEDLTERMGAGGNENQTDIRVINTMIKKAQGRSGLSAWIEKSLEACSREIKI